MRSQLHSRVWSTTSSSTNVAAGPIAHHPKAFLGCRPQHKHLCNRTHSSARRQPQQRAAAQPDALQAPQQSSSDASGGPSSWRLYSCRMPLVGLEGIADALEGTPAAGLLQLHTYLLLEGPDQSGVWFMDFLPLDATAPRTALLLLTGGRAPGEVRLRRLGVQQVKVTDRVRLVGAVDRQDPLVAIKMYNRGYDKGLHLLLNNCMHYTNGLSRLLLAQEGA